MDWTFELLAGPYGGTTEGPAWDGQTLLFTHIPGSRIMRYDPHTGACTEFRTGTHGTNGLMFDAQGRLWLLGRCSAKANDSDGVLYPLAVECAAGAVPGVGRTAFVMHRQRRLLAAEVEGDVAAVRAELMERLAWAKLADVVIVPRIPVDRRHNAKVEYPALLQVLDRARSPDIS